MKVGQATGVLLKPSSWQLGTTNPPSSSVMSWKPWARSRAADICCFLHIWTCFQMKMKEGGKSREAHWKYWDISRGWSILFPLLPLIHVMNHHWLHPHLSLSDRGRPQSNIHTPRTCSYFSIALHPWLPFSPSFTFLPSFFAPLKFSLLPPCFLFCPHSPSCPFIWIPPLFSWSA